MAERGRVIILDDDEPEKTRVTWDAGHIRILLLAGSAAALALAAYVGVTGPQAGDLAVRLIFGAGALYVAAKIFERPAPPSSS